MAALADRPVDEVLNIASGEPRTVLELATAMAAAFGVPSPGPLAPVVVGGGRPGDVRHIVASAVRAMERLGFRAERSFADGVADLVREHVGAALVSPDPPIREPGRPGTGDGPRYAPPVFVATKRVLVVEDDPTVAEVVVRYLEREGYEVSAVSDGRAAVEVCQRDAPDLLVLDVMLPGLDGLEVCRRVRSLAPVAVVMLTARGEEDDLVAGLEFGADDYLTKPFSPRELMARVKAVLRRTATVGGGPGPEGPAIVVADDLEVDVAAHEVRVGGRAVSLTAREFDLLVFLAQRPRQVFDKQELFERVWGFTFGDPATVTVHVRRLREKIESDPSAPRHLVTVWGIGYRFDP